MQEISKRFGDVVALAEVDFDLRAGEIHALLGENGAGKTTLMNVLSGLYRADAGRVLLDGRPVTIQAPREAVAAGIGMVHQHSELVGHFTSLENIVLGREGGGPVLRRAQRRAEVEALAARFGLALDLGAKVRTLPVGVQQKVEILKALYRGARILILDEPTTLLTPQEVDTLFTTLREVVAGGVTVVFITHKIREVLATCDRITVMRRGRIVATLDRAAADADRLIELMIGGRLAAEVDPRLSSAVEGHTGRPAEPAGRGTDVLAVEGLRVRDGRGVEVVGDVSFGIAAGELLGVAGVSGNGQRELAEAIAGVRPVAAGTIRLDGVPITAEPVRTRLLRGVAYIPDDRIGEGILPGQSVADTLLLGLQHVVFPGWRFDRTTAHRLAEEAIGAYRILCRDAEAPTASLSGGNIQKVIAARAFMLGEHAAGRVLVAMNPTRGLDVPSTRAIHQRLRAFCARGGGVLMISEDLDELMHLCDRLVVMASGRLGGEFPRAAYDPYRIGELMAGGRV